MTNGQLVANLGICRIEVRDIVRETLILHFLEIEDSVPCASLTLSQLEQIEKYETRDDIPVM